jgi:aminoglycoside phosphotransferase (APT) family kinase protein
MTPEDCLPVDLRGPATTITPVAAGLSGAGVYRVEHDGRAFVLKVAGEGEDAGDWRTALEIQRLAADAGVAPRIVHVDEARRAVVTVFVADRSFPALYLDPGTRAAALTLLGRTVRRIHALPLPAGARVRDPRAFLTQLSAGVRAPGFVLPAFAAAAIDRVLAEDPAPVRDAPVLGHNDLNPTNFIYDGERLLVLDWAAAGPMDAFYDLAVLAVFLRMDEATCLTLLAAYDDAGAPATALPDRFTYHRRLAAALAGTMQLFIARRMKHAGATGAETLDTTLSLGEFYQRMRAGELKVGTPDGQWAFGLALLKESLSV